MGRCAPLPSKIGFLVAAAELSISLFATFPRRCQFRPVPARSLSAPKSPVAANAPLPEASRDVALPATLANVYQAIDIAAR